MHTQECVNIYIGRSIVCIWFGALLDFRHPSGVLEPLPWVRGGGNHCTILLSRVAGQLKKGVGRIWNQSILAEGLVQRWCCGRQKELGVAGSRGRGTVARGGHVLWVCPPCGLWATKASAAFLGVGFE